MNLLPGKLIYGVAPEILIACAQQLHRDGDEPISFDDFCRALGAPRAEACPVWQHMLTDGFISLDKSNPDLAIPEQKLAQLALAKLTGGIKRADAEILLTKILARATEINANPEKYICTVACLAVFGSYLTDKPILGDLDVGFEISLLERPTRRPDQSIRDFIRGVGSPRTTVIASLRLRNPKQISLHEMNEVISLKTPYKVVFGEFSAASLSLEK